MPPIFREDKATQAAAVLLRRAGGSMNYMKLIKLLYLADRESLVRHGRPITFDHYVSMKHGPVLSTVLDRISEGDPPAEVSVWHQYIRRSGDYEVELRSECPADRLSDADENFLLGVYERYGHMDKWDLVEHLHEALLEWIDPGASALPISYRDILKASGRSDAEIAQIEAELESVTLAESLLGSAR